jgi:hypothetical protein
VHRTCSYPATSHSPAAKSGVYSSASDGTQSNNACCDNLFIGYTLPYPPGTVIIECGDAAGPNCPTGCNSSCGIDDAGEFCSRCASEQAPPDVQYSLSTGCSSDTVYGSWSVTLPSVVPIVLQVDAGLPPGTVLYTVHGSLTATLRDEDGTSTPVSAVMTLSF